MKVCQALVQIGDDVRLWLPDSAPTIELDKLAADYGLQSHIPIVRLSSHPLLRRYDFSIRAVFDARRWRPDLYYVWPYQAAALASMLGLPTLLELHDRPQGVMGPLLFRAFLMGSGSRRLLHTTEALRGWIEVAYRTSIRSSFAVLAPNGVELQRYQDLPGPAEARRQLGLKEGFTAGYTGHLYKGRGLGMLNELALRNPEISFLWVGGEASAVEKWQARIDAAGADNVRLMGFVSNDRLPMYQAASDVLLMPHQRRVAASSGGDIARFASPMKAFEYLAAGRAILTSDLPVIREILNEGNSILLPPEDVAAWNEALRSIARDENRRAELGKQARLDSMKYSWIERARRATEGLG